MAEVKKQVYVSKENLQKVLEFLKTQNETLYLRKGAEAASAAKVKKALTLTVGDTDVVFNGSEAKSAAVAAKVHDHTASNISDFDGAVKRVVFGSESTQGTVTAHKHENLGALDKISDDYITAWNAKIGVNDVAKLKYANDAMTGVADVKTAIDVLVKNVQIGSVAISATTANVNGLAGRLTTAESDIATLKTTVGDVSSGLVKDVADLKTSVGNNADEIANLKAANAEGGAVDTAIKAAKAAAEAAQTTANQAVADAADEAERAKGEEAKLAGRLDVVQGTGDGSIAKALDDAKKYAKEQADGKDAAIAAAKSAADAAQADVDALEGKVGEVPSGKTVIGLIGEAKAQADKGVAEAAAEKTRAEAAEKALDEKIKAEATARENADNSLDTKITNEIDRATGVENALDTRVTANKAAIDKLNGSVDTPGSVANAVKKEETRATAIEQGLRTDVNANKSAIETLNGDGEGSVNKKIQTAIEKVNTDASALEGRVAANEAAIEIINGTGEGSIKDAVAKLVNGAPEAMDTLKELADSITKHQTAYDAYVAQVAKDIAAAKQAAITEAGNNADTKDTALHNTITTEIATAKSEAISAAATDAAGKVDALENKLQPKIDAKVAQADYDTKVAALEKADADNLAAAKKHADDEDAKIEAILGHKAEGDLTATGLCADVAANAAAITAEATARQDADKLLSDRIAKFEEGGDNSVAAQVQAVQNDLDTFKEEQATKDQGQDANITANKNAIDAVKGRLDTAESKLNVIQGEGEGSIKKAVADAKSDIKNVTDGLGTRIDGLDTRVTALEGTINTPTTGLKDKMAAAEKDIDKLQADMTAAQGDINGINNNITTIQNTLKNLVPLTDDELQAMLNQVYAK